MKRARTTSRRRQLAWADFDDARQDATAVADARKAKKAHGQHPTKIIAPRAIRTPPRAIPGDDED